MKDWRKQNLLIVFYRPGNLLITVDHQLKITDFGTAEQLDM
jgi:serine/threonine protein kinase